MMRLRTGVTAIWFFLTAACVFTCPDAFADTTWVAPGDVSGNWTMAGSPYVVFNSQIPPDSTLTIQPGVRVYFSGPFPFVVYGRLTAVGTAQSAIQFVGADVDTLEDAWRGLVFISTDTSTADSSHLAYAILERANGPGYLPGSGGAIQCLRASPRFDHCTLRDNRSLRSRLTQIVGSRKGGGAYLFKSAAQFTACEFSSNNPGPLGYGGAVFVDDTCTAVFDHCVMTHDTAVCGGGVAIRNSGSAFYSCDISQNVAALDGGGIHLGPNYASFASCTISNNFSGQCGGGVFAYYHLCGPVFQACRILDNESFWGGGFYCGIDVGPMSVDRCLVVGNIAGYGGGMYLWRAWPNIVASTISYNTSTYEMGGGLFVNMSTPTIRNTVVSHSLAGQGIYFLNSWNMVLGYSDIAENMGGPFGSAGGQDMPNGLGVMVQTNANGDSCDSYHNIFFDPRFTDASGGDFCPDWLSPCLDAGDPDPAFYDPDGTIADIGAFYRDIASADPERTAVRHYELSQNYPNPFNAATRIEFDLPRASEAELSVYDINGRLVTTLLSGNLSGGHHNVHWDASNVPSGVYVYRLYTPDVTRAKKMVLIK